MRSLGLRTALSLKWQEQNLLIVDSCSVEAAKTALVNASLREMIGDDLALISDGNTRDRNFELASRNIKRVLYLPQLVCVPIGREL